MSQTPTRLVDLTLARDGSHPVDSLTSSLIRPLGMVHGAIAEAAVENGLAEWLAGGPTAFTAVEMIEGTSAGAERELRSIRQVALMRAPNVASRLRLLTDARPPIAGLTWTRPRILSTLALVGERGEIGERTTRAAVQRGRMLATNGADIVNVTATGANIADSEEVDRIVPVVEELSAQGFRVAISSRRPMVMRAAARAGARLVIDASPSIDDDTLYTLGDIGLPVILRRSGAIGVRPRNSHEALDLAATVHVALESRIEMFEGAGVPRDRIIIDPGVGAGQPADECIALLHAMSIFHGVGCPILADCDAFGGPEAREGAGASVRPGPAEVASAALSQGVQILAANEPAEVWPAAAGFRALASARFDETE